MAARDERGDDGGAAAPIVDLISGVVLTLLAIWALTWLIPNNMDMTAGSYDVAPSFIPNVAAWTVLVLSLGLIASSFRRWRRQAGQADDGPQWRILGDTMGWLIACALIYAGFRWLGFLVTGPVVLVLGLLFAGQRSWKVIITMAVLLPLILDVASWQVFTVHLP